MNNTNARKILELDPLVPGASEALEALLVSDQPFAQRVLACASMPGLGRRSGIELGDLVPLHGFRFVQQVVAGLLQSALGKVARGRRHAHAQAHLQTRWQHVRQVCASSCTSSWPMSLRSCCTAWRVS